MSKCVYLACMAVKIEHTAGGHNHDILQQCISDVYASQTWTSTRVKFAKNICFCPSKLICMHGKFIKINFVVFSVIFVL